jgi:hypothetical protein
MSISSASAAPLSLVPPATTQVGQAPQKCDDHAPQKFITGGGDAGAGVAAIGGGPTSGTQQALLDALRQALVVLTDLVTKLGGSTAVGGASGGGAPGQAPQKYGTPVQYSTPAQSDVDGASGPGQAPPSKTGVGGANGPGQSPGQYPGQFPGQYPGQFPTQGGGSADGGGPQGDVTLSEGNMEVTLASGDDTSVRIWGDPHVVVKLDGKTEKFNIGKGPGEVTLRDGTRISWDTKTNGNIISNMEIDRPGNLEGDVDADVRDSKVLKDERTGLTDAQLREFIGVLRQYEGDINKPLTLKDSADGGGAPGKDQAPGKHK